MTILDFDDSNTGSAHFSFDKWYAKLQRAWCPGTSHSPG